MYSNNSYCNQLNDLIFYSPDCDFIDNFSYSLARIVLIVFSKHDFGIPSPRLHDRFCYVSMFELPCVEFDVTSKYSLVSSLI